MIHGKVPPRVLRLEQVKEITGLSRSTIYEYMKDGKFPLAIKLGTHRVGWVASEVEAWIDMCIEERDTRPAPMETSQALA